LWVAWPCGLLQSALLVAALTGDPAAGAVAMAGFAAASTPGLVLAPWLWRRLGPGSDGWAIRAGGGLLAAAALFSLTHGLWQRVAAWCGLA
jgi:uncharacterized protein